MGPPVVFRELASHQQRNAAQLPRSWEGQTGCNRPLCAFCMCMCTVCALSCQFLAQHPQVRHTACSSEAQPRAASTSGDPSRSRLSKMAAGGHSAGGSAAAAPPELLAEMRKATRAAHKVCATWYAKKARHTHTTTLWCSAVACTCEVKALWCIGQLASQSSL